MKNLNCYDREIVDILTHSATPYASECVKYFKNPAISEVECYRKMADTIIELEHIPPITRIAENIVKWLEEQDNKTEVMVISSETGKALSANDLVLEIKNSTDIGLNLENQIIQLTIDLLFRGKEHISIELNTCKNCMYLEPDIDLFNRSDLWYCEKAINIGYTGNIVEENFGCNKFKKDI